MQQTSEIPTYVISGLISIVVAMLSSGVTRILLHHSAVKIQKRKEIRDKLDALFKQVRDFGELSYKYWSIDGKSPNSRELEGAILVRLEDFQSGISLLSDSTKGQIDLESCGLKLKRASTGRDFQSPNRLSSEITIQHVFSDIRALEQEGERLFRSLYG